jgi:hypothetical protein
MKWRIYEPEKERAMKEGILISVAKANIKVVAQG